MAITFDRQAIRTALALNDPAVSSFLDLQTGMVVMLTEGDPSPAQTELSQAVMDSYGDRFRYIPGGNGTADDAAVNAWFEAEGLAA